MRKVLISLVSVFAPEDLVAVEDSMPDSVEGYAEAIADIMKKKPDMIDLETVISMCRPLSDIKIKEFGEDEAAQNYPADRGVMRMAISGVYHEYKPESVSQLPDILSRYTTVIKLKTKLL